MGGGLVLERMTVTRIVATDVALNRASFTGTVMRTAPDEVLVIGMDQVPVLDDAAAIVFTDTGHHGVTLSSEDADWLMARASEWAAPHRRPSFAQGMVLGLPVKVLFDVRETRFVVPSALAADFEERYETLIRRERP